jgi:general secretion pathway protein G
MGGAMAPCRTRSPRLPEPPITTRRPTPGIGGGGFSLIELVIVVVIIGIIGAIAIPRFGRGTEEASLAALKADLITLRGAIELYRIEHQGLKPKDATVTEQLLGYTDIDGNVSPDGTKSAQYRFGPYLHRVPPLPVGIRAGNRRIHWTDDTGVGWLYSEWNFTMKAHASGEFDSNGIEYSTY